MPRTPALHYWNVGIDLTENDLLFLSIHPPHLYLKAKLGSNLNLNLQVDPRKGVFN
jgi:hypothetical protein